MANLVPRIHDLPEAERPRERLWAKGPEALSDAELLALVLRNGRHGESALHLAQRLLADFGSLRRIAAASPEELARYPGVGPAKAASLVAALHLARRAPRPGPESVVVKRPEDLAAVAREALTDARRERVVVLIFDSGNRLQRIETVSEGAIDRSLVPVREILNTVLRHDGRAFAVAHNHPSGDPIASGTDRKATADLVAAAQTAGLRFLDHVIVTETAWSSARVDRLGPG